MQTKNNTDKKGFIKAYHRLPYDMLEKVKSEIIDEMGWADTTWPSKLSGVRNLKKPERTILKMIFNKYGIKFN